MFRILVVLLLLASTGGIHSSPSSDLENASNYYPDISITFDGDLPVVLGLVPRVKELVQKSQKAIQQYFYGGDSPSDLTSIVLSEKNLSSLCYSQAQSRGGIVFNQRLVSQDNSDFLKYSIVHETTHHFQFLNFLQSADHPNATATENSKLSTSKLVKRANAVVEGLANLVPYRLGICNAWSGNFSHWEDGYSPAAGLFHYIEAEGGVHGFPIMLNWAMRGGYRDEIFTELTGSPVETWWSLYSAHSSFGIMCNSSNAEGWRASNFGTDIRIEGFSI